MRFAVGAPSLNALFCCMALLLAVLLVQPAAGAVQPKKCNPFTYRFKSTKYYNAHDCGTYTLYFSDNCCKIDWYTAMAICAKKGLELAPAFSETAVCKSSNKELVCVASVCLVALLAYLKLRHMRS